MHPIAWVANDREVWKMTNAVRVIRGYCDWYSLTLDLLPSHQFRALGPSHARTAYRTNVRWWQSLNLGSLQFLPPVCYKSLSSPLSRVTDFRPWRNILPSRRERLCSMCRKWTKAKMQLNVAPVFCADFLLFYGISVLSKQPTSAKVLSKFQREPRQTEKICHEDWRIGRIRMKFTKLFIMSCHTQLIINKRSVTTPICNGWVKLNMW